MDIAEEEVWTYLVAEYGDERHRPLLDVGTLW